MTLFEKHKLGAELKKAYLLKGYNGALQVITSNEALMEELQRVKKQDPDLIMKLKMFVAKI